MEEQSTMDEQRNGPRMLGAAVVAGFILGLASVAAWILL